MRNPREVLAHSCTRTAKLNILVCLFPIKIISFFIHLSQTPFYSFRLHRSCSWTSRNLTNSLVISKLLWWISRTRETNKANCELLHDSPKSCRKLPSGHGRCSEWIQRFGRPGPLVSRGSWGNLHACQGIPPLQGREILGRLYPLWASHLGERTFA